MTNSCTTVYFRNIPQNGESYTAVICTSVTDHFSSVSVNLAQKQL